MSMIRSLPLTVNTNASSNSLYSLATPETKSEFSLNGLTHEERIIIASLSYTRATNLELSFQQRLAEELGHTLAEGTKDIAADEWDADAHKHRALDLAELRKQIADKRRLTISYKTPTHQNPILAMKLTQKAIGVVDGIRFRFSDLNRIRKIKTGQPYPIMEKVSNGLGIFNLATSVFDVFVDLAIAIFKAYKKKSNESEWSLKRFYNNMKKDGRPIRFFGSILGATLAGLSLVTLGGSLTLAVTIIAPLAMVLMPCIAKIHAKLQYSTLLNKIQKQIAETTSAIQAIQEKIGQENNPIEMQRLQEEKVKQLETLNSIKDKIREKRDAVDSARNKAIGQSFFFAVCSSVCMLPFVPALAGLIIAVALMTVGIIVFALKVRSLCREYNEHSAKTIKRSEIEKEGEQERISSLAPSFTNSLDSPSPESSPSTRAISARLCLGNERGAVNVAERTENKVLEVSSANRSRGNIHLFSPITTPHRVSPFSAEEETSFPQNPNEYANNLLGNF